MNKSKSAVEEAEQWLDYVSCVKKRDQHRFAAEKADRERRNNWREYYKLDKRIKQLDVELGIVEEDGSDNPLNYPTDDETNPITKANKLLNAPVKKRKLSVPNTARRIDLTNQ